jgi:hypothetical protein
MRKFTKQQVDFICYEIGEWYVQWKNQLVDYETRTHRLGFAKEELKARICGEEYEDLEDEYDVNYKVNPWETEPDFLEFVDESTGYRCFVQRHPELKHLCGYVELPKEHKLYGKDYQNNEETFNKINVHGGVTYTGKKNFSYSLIKNCLNKNSLEICFTVDFVVGFDCAHAGDYSPYFLPWRDMNQVMWDETYKNIEYVTNECKKLAEQLKELE